MTWADFKKEVERRGISDKTEVGFIEVDFPEDGDELVSEEDLNSFSIFQKP